MVWNRKNEGKGLIVAILVPILIVVLISSIFFAILEGTIGKFLDFVEKVKGAIVGGATRGIQWLGFSTVKDGLSTFVIKKQNVEELRDMIESYNISTEATGMTEVRLRKMLLGYAVSNSLGDTICAVEVSEDEIIEDYNKKNPTNQKQTLDEVLAEYTKESSKKKWKLKKPNYDLYYTSKVFYYFKDEDKKFDSSEVKWYLAANGATTITTSDGDKLKYVEPTDFVKLKTEWEDPNNLNKLSTNPDSQYMKLITSYTKSDSSDGSNKIKIYTTDISEKSYYYCFENNSKLGSEEKNIKIENPEQEDGKEFKYDVDAKSTYKAIEEEIDLNDSIDLSNYAIPVELMMDMLNITGSGEFLETFIDYALAQIETSVTAYPLTSETVEYNQTKYTIDPNFTVELYDMYDFGTQSFAPIPVKIFGKELGQIEIGNIDLDNKDDNFIAYHDIIFNRKYAGASIPNNRVTSINNYKNINYNGDSYRRKLLMGTEQDATFSVDALESYLKSAYDPADDFQLGTINVQEVICKTSSQTKKQLMVNEIKTWYGDFKYQVSSPEVFYTVPGKDDNATQADYEGYNQTKMSATDAASKADESKETIYIYEKLVEQVKNQTPGLDASKEYHEQSSNDITNDPMNTENGVDNKNHFINWTIIGLNEIANNDGGEKNKDIKVFAGCDYMYCYYKKTNIKEYKAVTKTKREIVNESNIVQTTSSNDVRTKIDSFLELLRNKTGKIPTSIGSEGGFTEKSANPSIVVMYGDIYDGQAPVGNMLLDNGALMLFQLLESSENTQGNLTKVFKYMAYRYSGVDYGVTNIDDIAYIFDLYSVSGIYGGTIQEKVWYALKDLGFTDIAVAGAMGNIDYESGGFRTTAVEGGSGEGIGLLQWSYGRKEQLINYANYKGVDWTDEDTQVEFLVAEISGKGQAASFATHRTYGYIISEGPSMARTETDWKNSTTIEEATWNFMRYFESPGNNSSYNERLDRAIKYEKEFEGKTRPTTGNFNGNFLQIAEQCHEYLRVNNYYYSSSENKKANKYVKDNRSTGSSIPKPAKGEGNYIDCSAYVCWVLYEYGYKEFAGPQETCTYFMNRSQLEKKGWKYKNATQAVAGDIIVNSEHMEIYAGNGRYLNAGNTQAIRRPLSGGVWGEAYLNTFTYAITVK